MPTTRWLIGLASGSGAHGVDAALLETAGAGLDIRVRILQTAHQSFGRDLRDLVLRAVSSPTAELRHTALAHRLLGETFAAAARQVVDRASLSLQKVHLIGLPGQPLWHDADGRFPSTLAIGMPAVVAERTGVTVVSDFVTRDVAAGGQGSPPSALADYLLFRDGAESRAVVDLGGVTRIVALPAGCRIQEVVGFDAGPGNRFLDALMGHLTGGQQPFDPGGKHAVQGRCLEAVLARWLSHPYFQRRPPKSASCQLFNHDFAADALQQTKSAGGGLHDLLCTATHLVAQGVATSVQRFLPAMPARVLLCGGGVKNGLLWRLLEQALPGVAMERTDRYGVGADARKAVTSALLAAMLVDGVPGNIPSVTGAAGSRLVGSITPGTNANWARCQAWMASHLAA